MNGEFRYFSMFTGVGGFELGIQSANLSETKGSESRRDEENSSSLEQVKFPKQQFSCVGFSEIDKYASQLLANKFPSVRNYGDATKINPNELPDFDMLCGGFPCQAFSVAGKRRGFQDTRGTLFFEVARILKTKRPKIVLLENVKGLLNHNKGETFKVILETLDELGYETQWMVLNSKFFGVPQNRERIFIIGSLRGEPRPEILPFGEISSEINESEVSHTLPSSYHKITRGTTMIKRIDKQIGRDNEVNRIYSIDGINPTLTRSKTDEVKIVIPVLTPNREEKRQNGRRFKENGDDSFTLTKQDIHGVLIQSLEETESSLSQKNASVIYSPLDTFKIRRLTTIECERLQGFPDNWTEGFSDTQRYKMMGNAVTVNVIVAIISRLQTFINKEYIL